MRGEVTTCATDAVRALILDDSVECALAALLSRAEGIERHQLEQILSVRYAEMMRQMLGALGFDGASRIVADHAVALADIVRLAGLAPSDVGRIQQAQGAAQSQWLAFAEPRGRA